MLHHPLLKSGLEGVLRAELTWETTLSGKSALLLHREIVELLPVVAAAMLLLSKKFSK